jgi:hypothetical protein
LTQQVIDNAFQYGVTWGLSKILAPGLAGVLGVSIVGHIGWLIIVQTLGFMTGIKIAILGIGGMGVWGWSRFIPGGHGCWRGAVNTEHGSWVLFWLLDKRLEQERHYPTDDGAEHPLHDRHFYFYLAQTVPGRHVGTDRDDIAFGRHVF